jgi:3-deoxy-manno-octulosonate cytidylyltransferase (CMP-KDO synthetase)
MKTCIIIPARMTSTRFYGKPLASINGQPMILRVIQQCRKVFSNDHIYVATDDDEILNVVRGFGGNGVKTNEACLTGTDRIAEANEQLNYDYVINVQGDEPVIDHNSIAVVAKAALENISSVINLCAKINTDEEYYSRAVPKCVFDNNNNLLYMSRTAVPGGKTIGFQKAYKQVCVYGFSREHLKFIIDNPRKTPLESIEDIEILRFVESGIAVKMLQVEGFNISVDYEDDVRRVERYLEDNGLD